MSTFWKDNGLNVKASNTGDNHDWLLMGKEARASVIQKDQNIMEKMTQLSSGIWGKEFC